MKNDAERGINVSLRIPAPDPDLFKNKSTNEVLLFLSRHRFDEYSIRELATQIGNKEPTVRRAVDLLQKNDLVVDRPKGNRRQVSVNRERLSIPEDPHLQIPQSEFQKPVKAAVEDYLKYYLDEENIQAIILYGSVARGEADRRSDIDLWVLVSENRSENQREVNKRTQELEEKEFDGNRYSYDIDVESVSSIPKYTDDIRQIVLSGIPLYEGENFETIEKLLMNEVSRDE